MTTVERIEAPAVVVGGGIGGLATALSLDGCVLAADGPIGGGSSRLAQGGVAAALGTGDSPALHAADTVRVGAGLVDEALASAVAREAPARIDWLAALGVAFDRAPDGGLALGREAGHGRARIVHAGGDRTGDAVMQALRAAVLARPDIRVLEGPALADLLVAGDRAAGVLLSLPDGRPLAVVAPQVVLATGGVGACFESTTNPECARGTGLAAAARLGVRLADLEFMQFHPTALAVGGGQLPLLTEALRGAGAVLTDEAGERFMPAIHPDAELAPRDVVARSVAALRAGGREVFLDLSPVAALQERFPGALAIARAAGRDATGRLPVTAAAHFHMGGIATDARGATSLPGLWAVGEVAATGLHGGNRLASNSLLEGLVFAGRAARAIVAAPRRAPRGALERPARPACEPSDAARLAALRRLVGSALGPLRDGPALAAATRRLDAWTPGSHAEEDLVLLAQLMLASALARRESRGAHYRTDWPGSQAAGAARRFVTPQAQARRPLDAPASRVA